MNLKAVLVLLTLPLLCQCQSIFFADRVVQQGNYLPEKKVNQLKIGMSKAQIESTLGSSLIASTFDNNRVDYAFTYKQGTKAMKLKHLTLTLKQGKLVEIKKL